MSWQPGMFRPIRGRLEAQLPFDPGNRAWLRQVTGTGRHNFDRDARVWLVARTHFGRLRDALVTRYGRADICTEHRTYGKCHVRCQDAEGDYCECPCLYRNHGLGLYHYGGWTLVRDDVLVQPNGTTIRCVTLTE